MVSIDKETADDLLVLEDLSMGFQTESPKGALQTPGEAAGGEDVVAVLRRVSLRIGEGECLGLVGESGCGKSLTALSILGLLPAGGRFLSGQIHFSGRGDLLALDPSERRRVRGREVGMIFQEPRSALNPVLTIGFQIREALRHSRRLRGAAARRETLRLLDRVAIPDAARRERSYPHELSGGQLQRVMIAMALAGRPRLLLADEPTTALDVTVQAQILELLSELRRDLGLTVMLITHDLGVVAENCERVAVMYAGQVVEEASVEALYRRPAHPYTRALLEAVPRLSREGRAPAGIPGQVPELDDLPPGCAFSPRCRETFAPCETAEPELEELGSGHRARCFLWDPSRRSEDDRACGAVYEEPS